VGRIGWCMGAWVHGCMGAWVHGCMGAWTASVYICIFVFLSVEVVGNGKLVVTLR